MKTKTLLLTVALGAASAATSMAQVYSANAVGYVNLTLQAGYNLIANPLNGTNNHLNTILPLPNSAADTTIYRFKPNSQNYGASIIYFADFGWYSDDGAADPNWYVINPGEGFFIRPSGPTPLTVTFVGEVPQGNLSKAVVGNNNYSILSSQVPQALPLGATGQAGTLMFPAAVDDAVYIFNPVTQLYKATYVFFQDYGWFSDNADDPGPLGPTIPVGTSFFVQKKGPLNQTWNRQFTVN